MLSKIEAVFILAESNGVTEKENNNLKFLKLTFSCDNTWRSVCGDTLRIVHVYGLVRLLNELLDR